MFDARELLVAADFLEDRGGFEVAVEVLRTFTGRAFLTGSYVYSTPRADSDIDLCVHMTHAAASGLSKHADEFVDLNRREEIDYPYSADRDGYSARFGKLNLLIFTESATFESWRRATVKLIAERPVTREHARAVIRAECGHVEIVDDMY